MTADRLTLAQAATERMHRETSAKWWIDQNAAGVTLGRELAMQIMEAR